ncbi:MAG: uracil-xanthine permease [Kiritimatiellae bacterium]|nr:uracil-xanthine permease [Kiritimatiellia bacterium]
MQNKSKTQKSGGGAADGPASALEKGIVGVQFLFVAFGGTVLMPLLVGMNPSTALFAAGVGTLLFHAITKGSVPVFLGSSFAYIAPIPALTQQWGLDGAMTGFLGAGLVYLVVSALVRWRGTAFLNWLFPPVVVGPTIMLIGLMLTPTAVEWAQADWLLACVSLAVSIAVMMWGRGLLRLLPVVCGIAAGYVLAVALRRVDFAGIAAAPWVALPSNLLHPHLPRLAWQPFVCLMPIALAGILEHVGDIYVIGQIAGKDFVHAPGIHRTLLGDGVAILVSSFVGGPPVTTYSEVTGAVQITRVTDPAVLRITAATAIAVSLFGKMTALLQSIPKSVLGGIMLLLFGTIASVGVQSMIRHKVDFSDTRNLVIAGVMLSVGIGGVVVRLGTLSLSGIGVAALVGLLLNLLLPRASGQNPD